MKSLELKAIGLEELDSKEARGTNGGNPFYIIREIINAICTAYGAGDIVSDFIAGWNDEKEKENSGCFR